MCYFTAQEMVKELRDVCWNKKASRKVVPRMNLCGKERPRMEMSVPKEELSSGLGGKPEG